MADIFSDRSDRMPVNDGKRLTGPETSLPYSVFSSCPKEEKERGGRGDGRGAEQHRKVFLSTGVISQAQGSAYLEQGDKARLGSDVADVSSPYVIKTQ